MLTVSLPFWFSLLPACTRQVEEPADVLSTRTNSSHFDIENTRAPRTLDHKILEYRTFTESPLWDRKVASGALPSISERLPDNPRVIVPFKETGSYGGEIRRALTGDIVQIWAVMKAQNEGLFTFSHPYANTVEPNLAERWEFNDGGKQLLVHLRDGIYWSDGHPFTADDVTFYYNDVMFDVDARPTDRPPTPSSFLVDGKPIQLEKLDDLTLRFSSHKPVGRLLTGLAAHGTLVLPSHIFMNWHPRYNAEASYEDIRQKATMAYFMFTPGMPNITAWIPKEWHRGERLVFERNPYYWKVDTAGQQLPYVDRTTWQVIPEKQVILLKFLNGEIDLFGRYSQIDMLQTLKQAEAATHKFTSYLWGPNPAQAFYLNWDAPNPYLRQAFRNRDVRIALSLAINREEINQLSYQGYLVAGGYSFYPPNPDFNEASFAQFSEHDPERAKQLLERAGYKDTDGDRIREFAENLPFEITIDMVSAGNSKDLVELVASYWEQIGIKVNVFAALRDIIMPRRYSGEFEVHTFRRFAWAIDGPNQPYWHRNAATEGPEWLHEATRQFERAATTTDPVVIRESMAIARDLHTNNIPNIAIGASYHAWGANNRLGNIAENVSGTETNGGLFRLLSYEQIFIKQD